MQKISAIAVVIAAAGTAWASPVLGDYSTYTQLDASNVTATAIDGAQNNNRGTTSVFSNMETGPDGYVAFGAAAAMGFDDYTSTSAGAFDLTSMRFVGGLATGGTLLVEFFNAAGDTLLNGFTIGLGAGNFIYTITLGGGFTIDGAGIVQMSNDDAAGGQWFLGNDGPSVGSEDVLFGGSDPFSHNFELNVPAPGSIALLGLGGLVATRRRR